MMFAGGGVPHPHVSSQSTAPITSHAPARGSARGSRGRSVPPRCTVRRQAHPPTPRREIDEPRACQSHPAPCPAHLPGLRRRLPRRHPPRLRQRPRLRLPQPPRLNPPRPRLRPRRALVRRARWKSRPRKSVITTPTPGSSGPMTEGEAGWERIRTAGKLLAGTSSGSAPFAQQGSDFGLDGFDVALAREIGRRLGLQVQVVDLAAEGLPTRCNSARWMWVLPPWQPPWRGQGRRRPLVLTTSARPRFWCASMPPSASCAALPILPAAGSACSRARASRHGPATTWWQPARLPASDLLVYRDIEQAVGDLGAGRSDAVVLDSAQAQRFCGEGWPEGRRPGAGAQPERRCRRRRARPVAR